MGIIFHTLDETLMCRCGHRWSDHHHGCVMNSEYYDYPLTINGCIAEECEYNQMEGYFAPRKNEKTMCKCPNFKPRAHSVQKLVNEWRKNHDEMRKNKNG